MLGIALSTIKNFPSTFLECCHWTSDKFEKQFVTIPELVNKFFESNANIDTFTSSQLWQIQKIVSRPCNTWEDCITYGKLLFDQSFTRKIERVLEITPPDSIDCDGSFFWSHGRREPHPILFDPTNQRMVRFVLSAATIHARIFGITPGTIDPKAVAEIVQPKKARKESCPMNKDEEHEWAQALYNNNVEWQGGKRILNPEPFEKDSEVNMHMDFMEAAANLRAENYRIPLATQLAIKKIVGKITPAIITTTAMVTGFLCLEMYKVHSLRSRPIMDYRSGLVNLGTNTTNFWQPNPVQKMICLENGMEFDQATFWSVEGNLTIQEFIDECLRKYNITVSFIAVNKGMIYINFPPYDKNVNKNLIDYSVEKGILESPYENADQNTIQLYVDGSSDLDYFHGVVIHEWINIMKRTKNELFNAIQSGADTNEIKRLGNQYIQSIGSYIATVSDLDDPSDLQTFEPEQYIKHLSRKFKKGSINTNMLQYKPIDSSVEHFEQVTSEIIQQSQQYEQSDPRYQVIEKIHQIKESIEHAEPNALPSLQASLIRLLKMCTQNNERNIPEFVLKFP